MRAGDRLGPYLLRREIGEGGIASVFVAVHSDRQVDVVLKVFRAELRNDDATLAIFLGEPRALQAVEHEGTLEVTDVVEDGPAPYFATELLRGRTLSELLRRGRLPLSRALHIARQVATVLAHAHDVDVVHRNLKPTNVFLVDKDGEHDVVKLLELGATRMQSMGEKPVPGTVIGTPAYMAPEQLRQLAGDHRVDMYAFGVMLFELVVGRRPFVGEVADLFRQHLLEKAPRARAFAPDVPEVLDQLIAQCLEKEPDKRPPSMHEVSLALAALEDSLDLPVPAHDDGAPTSIAVPKNTSGFTTVAADVALPPPDVAAAPPPVVADEDEEPSFPTITAEREAVSAPPSSEQAEPAEPAEQAEQDEPQRSDARDAQPAARDTARPSPSPALDAPEIDPGTRPPAPRKNPLVPALIAAGVLALVVIGAVLALRGGDDTGGAEVPPPAVGDGPAPPPPPDPEPVQADAGAAAQPDAQPDAPPDAQPDAQPNAQPATPDPNATQKPTPGAPQAEYSIPFRSSPAGAQVWIRMDRRIRMLCNTPCEFSLPTGKEVLVELRLDGHTSVQRTITVGEGVRVDGTLRRR